jgi:hypothetical protein
VMSMIKRRQGGHVCGRSFWSQCRDLRLLALTHNVMILVLGWVFYRASPDPFVFPALEMLADELKMCTSTIEKLK